MIIHAFTLRALSRRSHSSLYNDHCYCSLYTSSRVLPIYTCMWYTSGSGIRPCRAKYWPNCSRAGESARLLHCGCIEGRYLLCGRTLALSNMPRVLLIFSSIAITVCFPGISMTSTSVSLFARFLGGSALAFQRIGKGTSLGEFWYMVIFTSFAHTMAMHV